MIVYFSAQLPSDKVPVAGQKIAWNHLNELNNPNEVIIFSFINKTEKPYFNPKNYKAYKKTYFSFLNKNTYIYNCLRNIIYPFKVSGRYSEKIFNQLILEIKNNNVEKVVFEFTSSMLYAKKLNELYPEIDIHFVEHDITFQSYYRLSKSPKLHLKIFYYFEYLRMKKFELENLTKFKQIFTLNFKDLKLLNKFKIYNVKIKYPRVEEWIYKVNRSKIKKHTILFLGAMHRKENQDAVIWFVKNVMPALIKSYPSLKFYVVGAGVTNEIKKLNSENIIITGFVEKLEDYFEFVQIAVVPLNFGAGIKIKTVETVSAKILTIASEVGAEGVENNKYLKIANSIEEFKEAILNEFKYA